METIFLIVNIILKCQILHCNDVSLNILNKTVKGKFKQTGLASTKGRPFLLAVFTLNTQHVGFIPMLHVLFPVFGVFLWHPGKL